MNKHLKELARLFGFGKETTATQSPPLRQSDLNDLIDRINLLSSRVAELESTTADIEAHRDHHDHDQTDVLRRLESIEGDVETLQDNIATHDDVQEIVDGLVTDALRETLTPSEELTEAVLEIVKAERQKKKKK